MKPRISLFRRTVSTVALVVLVFQLAAGTAMFVNLVLPLGNRSANDLADLLVLSARVWNQLPPQNRQHFVLELRNNFNINMVEPASPLIDEELPYPYTDFLRTALLNRLPPDQIPLLSENHREHIDVEFKLGEKPLRFEFSKSRILPTPNRGFAFAWIVLAGVWATLILSWLLARRVTEPVARLAEAAKSIGNDGKALQLPETGDAELADLAHVFNETSRQLQARRENQSTLLAGVSHDLRSPLARMKMAVGMIGEEYHSPLLERMERDIEEMNELIGAQLELARAQEREPTEGLDIDALLGEMVEATEAQAPGRIQLRVTQPPCTATLAPVALRRCISNLLDNALRYGGNTKIQVVRRRFQDVILIGVRDHGSGIPVDLTEVVFRPFYRIESSRSRVTGGSGLGLAITRQLCDTHGWKVALKPRRGGGVSAWLVIGG